MSDDIFTRLAEPFDPSLVSWRVGSTNKRKFEAQQAKERKGQVFAYIDARDVMNRLDEVVGPPHWQARYVPMPNGTTCCEIGIRCERPIAGDEWIWKANGAGATGDVDNENEREMAEKGGYSDALKRAAVLWGVGRYLYDIKNPWIELDERWSIPDAAYAKLRNLLPNAKSAYRARKDGDYDRIVNLLRACVNIQDLQSIWKTEQKLIASWPDNWQEHITEEKDRIKSELMARQAA